MASSHQPLSGQSIVITRPRAQSQELYEKLELLGAKVIALPTIKIIPPDDIRPLQSAVGQLHVYDWVMFTSRNAVDAVAEQLGNELPKSLGKIQIAAVGKATHRRLQDLGIAVHLVPSKYNVAELCTELKQRETLAGKRILYPCGNLVKPESVLPLHDAGVRVDMVVAYRTAADDSADYPNLQKLLERNEVNAIVFASPSAARCFLERIPPQQIPSSTIMVSIGPSTSAALNQLLTSQIYEAKQSNTQGLIDALVHELGKTS